jgi:ABC-type bacteriocin/lantibiotic exporter with double-glycine peptidase domain
MIRVRGIRQHDHSDCGAACLCSIARAYGYHMPLSRIRELASTERAGTNVMGLVEAADKMGFIAKGVKGPPEALNAAPLPSIAHLEKGTWLHHFVVLTLIGKRYAKYMDPETGTIRKVRIENLRNQWTGVLVIIAPGPEFRKKQEDPGLTARFLRLVRPFRHTILQALVGAILYSLLGLSTSVFVQKIMDFVLLNQNFNLLNLMGTAMVGLLILRILISWFKSLYLMKVGHQIDAGLLLGYYRHLLSLPQRFFDTMRTGEILSRMNDAIKIRLFINQSLIEMIVALLTVILTLLAMAVLSKKLCLLVLASLLIYLLLFAVFDRINKKVLRQLMEETAGLESRLVESVQFQRTIRGFGWKTWAINRTADKLTGVLKVSYRAGIASILSAHAVDLVSGLLTILMLWTGAVSVIRGAMTPGELMSFYAMLGYLLGPLRNLGNMNRMLRDAIIAAERLFQILDLDQEKNAGAGIPVNHFSRNIEFRRIGFRYGSRPELFSDLSFIIPCGKLTGIVGRSGSGKSSIAAMLRAEHLPDRGNLLINNCDIRQIDRSSLRKKIGIVPQHIELFSGSILENISPGESRPDLKRLLECAGRTGLTRLLRDLPDGFNTEIGELGNNLSGGERQRIAFTRALYHEPELLILDEATAALDPVSESEILELIDDLRRDSMTLIIISHKLRQVRDADHIVMIDRGKAAETGRHEDLIKSDGPYRELWTSQNAGN